MPDEPYQWTRYFDAVKGLPPRETLMWAMAEFDREDRRAMTTLGVGTRRMAVDLGAGDGRDTIELLARGWNVIAIDSAEEAIKRIMDRVPVEQMDRLEARVQRFEDAKLPPCDLVNASFAIPHCDPAEFDALWANITGPIKPGGRFAGQLFGVNDSWAQNPDGVTRTYHTRAEVDALLARASLVPELLDEVERPGKNAFNEPKHWHVFHVLARKGG